MPVWSAISAARRAKALRKSPSRFLAGIRNPTMLTSSSMAGKGREDEMTDPVERVDVLVAGGGYVGLSAALAIAASVPGARVAG